MTRKMNLGPWLLSFASVSEMSTRGFFGLEYMPKNLSGLPPHVLLEDLWECAQNLFSIVGDAMKDAESRDGWTGVHKKSGGWVVKAVDIRHSAEGRSLFELLSGLDLLVSGLRTGSMQRTAVEGIRTVLGCVDSVAEASLCDGEVVNGIKRVCMRMCGILSEFEKRPGLSLGLMDGVERLVVSNLRQELSKEEVVSVLNESGISVRAYNEFVMRKIEEVFSIEYEFSKTLGTDVFLDEEYLRSVVDGAAGGEAFLCERTLFEERGVPTECYVGDEYLSFRLVNGMLSREEVYAKFTGYAKELGLCGVSDGCAKIVLSGLELYIREVFCDCRDGVSVQSLKRSLGKHLRLFNGVDVLF